VADAHDLFHGTAVPELTTATGTKEAPGMIGAPDRNATV
jgi:hypothetical protein